VGILRLLVPPVLSVTGFAQTFDLCPFEQIVETPFHALPSAGRTRLRRENPILTNHGGSV
jgi:hypothetical protein